MKLYKMMIVLAILAIAGVAEARLNYIIHFRNGKEVAVSKYKEAGDQIKYFRFGGWMSVPKALIAEIQNRDNGEKRVYNPYQNEQETKALRKSQAARLNKILRKQEIRDSASESEPQIKSPVARQGKRGGITENAPAFDWGRCMATGQGTSFGRFSSWENTRSERLEACSDGIRYRERSRRRREKARREKALYDEVVRERERVRVQQRLREKGFR